jgi:anaerobic magnesium-protoporphyrin IX monomethyl ester cyclase
MKRKLVLLINPSNSSSLREKHPTFGSPAEHSDWSNYPAAGILSLASSLGTIPNVYPVYLDGVVCPMEQIYDFITSNRHDIAAIAISALTDTYEAGLKIFKHSRSVSSSIIHIIGNDHFSAVPRQCLQNQDLLIDFGILGNEVIGSFRKLIDQIVNDKSSVLVPHAGMVMRDSMTKQILFQPPSPETIFTEVDYKLIDEVYPHTAKYDHHFQASISPHMKTWFNRVVSRGIALEIARGCIKFKDDNACSFCSIQYGGMWKNSVSNAQTAWNLIEHARKSGYDYFYITADELGITFRELLLDMKNNKPNWIKNLHSEERPVFTGYSRSDGLIIGGNAELLYDLGFRLIMIGVDAGPKISLKAFNKHLTQKNEYNSLNRLYEANLKAFARAQDAGLKLRIGFVVGHIGMTKELLVENVEYFRGLVDNNPQVVAVADIEILSPEPGSKEYEHLTHPEMAFEKARELGLAISDSKIRGEIANKWKGRDIFDREELIGDYIKAFMPDLSLQDLIFARMKLRDYCRDHGIMIGEL